MEKLRLLGIEDCFLQWIDAFLRDRFLYVVVDGDISDAKHVKSGVPQGSVLVPILFLIYINFLAYDVRCKFYIFADNLKIYLQFRIFDTTDTLLDLTTAQNDINLIFSTAKSWGLNMNRGKCVLIRFQRNEKVNWHSLGPYSAYYLDNTPLRFVESHSDLGVTVDCSLKFHLHIQSIASKAANLMSNILRSTLSRSHSFMLPIYKTYIHPLLEYSVCVWATGYICDLSLLENIQ